VSTAARPRRHLSLRTQINVDVRRVMGSPVQIGKRAATSGLREQTVVVLAGTLFWTVLGILLLMLLTVLIGESNLAIVTRLAQWGLGEAPLAAAVAASLSVGLGAVLLWIWRQDLAPRRPTGWKSLVGALKFSLVWSLSVIGALALLTFFAESLVVPLWTRRPILVTALGLGPGVALAYVCTGLALQHFVVAHFSGIAGDARRLPRSLTREIKRAGLLPASPWWGYVREPEETKQRYGAGDRTAALKSSGWLVGRDFLAIVEFKKSLPKDSFDTRESTSNWKVSGRVSATFHGKVQVRYREVSHTPVPPSHIERYLAGRVGGAIRLSALPQTLLLKVNSVTDPDLEFLDGQVDEGEVVPKSIQLVRMNAHSLVAVLAERLNADDLSARKDPGRTGQQETWQAWVLRADLTEHPQGRPSIRSTDHDSAALDPWRDWESSWRPTRKGHYR